MPSTPSGLDHPDWKALRSSEAQLRRTGVQAINKRAPRAFLVVSFVLVVAWLEVLFSDSLHSWAHVFAMACLAGVVYFVLTEWPHRRSHHRRISNFRAGSALIAWVGTRQIIHGSFRHRHNSPTGH